MREERDTYDVFDLPSGYQPRSKLFKDLFSLDESGNVRLRLTSKRVVVDCPSCRCELTVKIEVEASEKPHVTYPPDSPSVIPFTVCQEDGCTRTDLRDKVSGLCGKHYQRAYAENKRKAES